MIELKPAPRGFLRGEFEDRSGQKCSIQESSFTEEPTIWLGIDVDIRGQEVLAQMHLTRSHAKDLLPLIRHFARTGELGYDDPKEVLQVGTWVVGVGDTNRGVEGRVVEVAIGQHIIVQDNRRVGDEGKIVCLWDMALLVWEVQESPENIPSRYERLVQDDLV